MMLYWVFYDFSFKFNRNMSWDIWNFGFFLINFGAEGRGRFYTFRLKIMGNGGIKKPEEVEVIYT